MTASGSSADLAQLSNDIAKLFNKEELVLLCDGLRIDYVDLAGDTKPAKVRELVQYCERRGRLQELVDTINRERPYANLQIPTKFSNRPTEHGPLSPLVILVGIISGIFVTVVGGLIVFRLTQEPTTNATFIATPTVAPAVISLASTLTPQPSPSNEPTKTSEPSPIPATPTTAAPQSNPTQTPAPSPILPTPAVTHTQTSNRTFPCSGVVDHNQATKVEVKTAPDGETLDLVNVGKNVSVTLSVTRASGIWYSIVYDRTGGYIREGFLVLGSDCPEH